MKINIPQNSLRELSVDPRDFSVGAVFGQIKIEEVPNENFVTAEPILIKNQGETDMCSAYAVTAVSEDQESIELLPEYQFYKTKRLSGDPEVWGADLRTACKSVTKYGSLPNISEFARLKGLSRREVLTDETYPSHADLAAAYYKKQTYFSVDGRYDTFDNIRTRLWENRDKKRSIVTGILWRYEWIEAEGGIIPTEYGEGGFGHAFKIFGQKIINGEIYLEAQLSQGTEVGDRGLFYFNREVTNKEIGKYGIFMFNDLSRVEVEAIIKKRNTVLYKIWSYIMKLFN